MAINWGLLDTETPLRGGNVDYLGEFGRGLGFANELNRQRALPALRQSIQTEAMGMEGGESLGALAQVDPAAAFDALEARRQTENRLTSAEQIAADRLEASAAAAKAKLDAGVRTPEQEAATQDLAANTAQHNAIVNEAIRLARSNADAAALEAAMQKAYQLEDADLVLKSKAAQLKIAVYYANSLGIKKSINDALDKIEDREIRQRLAAAQQKIAEAGVANVGLQRQKLAAETKKAEGEAEGGTADQRKAAGFADEMVAGDRDILKIGKPTVASETMAKIYGGSTEFDIAARRFLNAILRYQSGAAITVGDYETVGPQYIPSPIDDENTLKMKAAARKSAIAAMRKSAGPANTPAANRFSEVKQ
jgi:hypothetical protein